MPRAPATGMMQVNINNGNTRNVRRKAADYGSVAFEARVFGFTRTYTAARWRFMRFFDFPWVVAQFEGESFDQFLFTLILEAVLNFTNTANTFLEGDLRFENDPDHVVASIMWLLTAMDVVSIGILVTETRRNYGHSCCCLPGHRPDAVNVRRGLVFFFAWFTLVHDAFQILFASAATASQVAGSDHSYGSSLAIPINLVEVLVLVFIKLYTLFNWDHVWSEQDASAKLARCTDRICGRRARGSTAIMPPLPMNSVSSAAPSVSSASRSAPMVAPATEDHGVPSFSHRAPNGAWKAYAPEQAAAIATAMAQQPAGGQVQLGGLPFVVKWGTAAVSPMMATPPSGMLQVNTRTEATRAVRKEDDRVSSVAIRSCKVAPS